MGSRIHYNSNLPLPHDYSLRPPTIGSKAFSITSHTQIPSQSLFAGGAGLKQAPNPNISVENASSGRR